MCVCMQVGEKFTALQMLPGHAQVMFNSALSDPMTSLYAGTVMHVR
jgi:hypothetical protein